MLLINKTLIRLARGLWGWIIAIVIVRFFSLIGITQFSKIIAQFLGNMANPTMTMDHVGSALLSAAAMAVIMLISQLLQGELEYRCTAKARTMIRTKIFSKVLDLDEAHVEKIGPVSAITASVDAVESVQIYYSSYLPSLLFSLIAPIYLFVTLRGVDLWIAVILLMTALVLLPVNNLFRGKIEQMRKVYWSSVEDMTACYLDSIRGLTTLKLFGQTERRRETLGRKAEKLNQDINKFMRVNFTSFLVTEGLIYAAIVVSVGIACGKMAGGTMTLSNGLTVLLLSYSFFSSIRQLMNATHAALAAVAAAGKISDIFAIDTSRPYHPEIPAEANSYPGIDLQNVSFHYEGREETLHQINLKVEKGKMTALVGLSGCGKSTIASLISKFIDPDHGRILLEGRDYSSFLPKELRRQIVMVPQTVSLFSGTLRDNLLIGKQDATDEELLEVLEEAALGDFIQNEPDGLDTDVGDAGARLSGGQRQKIGIARALLSKAQYIIFDEATSSVDVKSEQDIWNCISRLSLSRTLIIITHRLSSIRNADQIYLIEKGQIKEFGRHEELMQEHGVYYALVNSQKEEVNA